MNEPNIKYLNVESLIALYSENKKDRALAKRNWPEYGGVEVERLNRRKQSLCSILDEFETNLLYAKHSYDAGDLRLSAAAINEAIGNLRAICTDEHGVKSIPGPYFPLDTQWMFYQPIQYTKILYAVRTNSEIPFSVRYLFGKANAIKLKKAA